MRLPQRHHPFRSRVFSCIQLRHAIVGHQPIPPPRPTGSRFLAILPRSYRAVGIALAGVVHKASIHSITSTMDTLVQELQHEGRLKAPNFADAMRAVDRAQFVARDTPPELVYSDAPLPLGYGETISAPHMHAACLDLLQQHLQPGAHVLDVGSGSGYLTAVMGLIVGPSGRVVGVEKHPELAKQSTLNLQAAVPHLLQDGTVSIHVGNVLQPGLLSQWGPFDAIHVGAAANTLPTALVRQLRPGGRMVIPVGPRNDYQVLQVVDKGLGEDDPVRVKQLFYVRYVPLTHPFEDS